MLPESMSQFIKYSISDPYTKPVGQPVIRPREEEKGALHTLQGPFEEDMHCWAKLMMELFSYTGVEPNSTLIKLEFTLFVYS